MKRITIETESIKKQKGEISVKIGDIGKVLPHYCDEAADILSDILNLQLNDNYAVISSKINQTENLNSGGLNE